MQSTDTLPTPLSPEHLLLVRPVLNGHRLLEITALSVVLTLCACLLFRLAECLSFGDVVHDPLFATRYWGWAIAGGLLGYVSADFGSGLFHWMADRFGTERTPYWGRHFVRPFRQHHVDPKEITRHDFIETNGNTAILLFPVTAALVFLLSNQNASNGHVLGLAAALSFSVFGFVTNQIHQWAHADHAPGLVQILQRAGIILAPKHHDIHHTHPHATHYCITAGQLNGLLRSVHFFEVMEWLAWKVLGIKAAEGGEDAERLALHGNE